MHPWTPWGQPPYRSQSWTWSWFLHVPIFYLLTKIKSFLKIFVSLGLCSELDLKRRATETGSGDRRHILWFIETLQTYCFILLICFSISCLYHVYSEISLFTEIDLVLIKKPSGDLRWNPINVKRFSSASGGTFSVYICYLVNCC